MDNSPERLLKKGSLQLPDVPLNNYSLDLRAELRKRGKTTLLGVYRDMLYIRRFEEALLKSKKEGLLGYSFKYASHLSIGQEAVSVGEALALTKQDIIFGTHRSHGEFLAKSLRFIELSNKEELEEIFTSYPVDTYKTLMPFLSGDAKEDAVATLLYGAFSEIFARTTGFQRGLGGSMHLHFTPFGVYPNNAIVGGSAPLAVGASLFNRINNKDGIVVANLGDGALNCGAVYESIALATMNQYKNLWHDKKGLPIIFVVSDNLYARGGNTRAETGSYDNPARLGAGFTPNAMHSESVNGLNPFAVADALERHRLLVEQGDGASFINCTTYRHTAHSIGDKNQRNPEEIENWLKLDPIINYKRLLLAENVASEDDFSSLESSIDLNVLTAYSRAVDTALSPMLNLKNDGDAIRKYTFNNGAVDKKPSNSALQQSDVYKTLKDKNDLTLKESIKLGIIESFICIPKLVAYGEDVRNWDSDSSVFFGLEKYLPYEKLFNTPISEAAIVGAEVGYAMRGGVALSELLYADFLTRAADEIINQTAKWQALSGGTLKLPLTLRLPIGRSYGGQHSQDLSGIIARIPGLKVYYPVTPFDALAVMKHALASTDPCIIFEPKEYYSFRELFKDIPKNAYPVENSSLKLEGSDVTIVTVGSCLYDVYDAVIEKGKSVDLISAVSLSPIDYNPIILSVQKTGKLIVVGEANVASGIMSEIASTVQKACFSKLKSPIEIVGLDNTVVPPSGEESGYYDIKEKLLKLL